jgi:hypothetical protein
MADEDQPVAAAKVRAPADWLNQTAVAQNWATTIAASAPARGGVVAGASADGGAVESVGADMHRKHDAVRDALRCRRALWRHFPAW